ncbi:MAG: hypothetical protein LKF87_06605 [Clostridium tyrobutyricum]|uniref:hypothetical protein n=1 Tax=Clostridium tyrobutyricum TaxID=1519 RepID=UPI00243309BB|nr:hypothetical protein [Clostridium tyrobutyricum]MCH4237994.1 hypothetical protein [Clostridium tyrobutyricum]MCH4258627.1 hypothetical protein [Clostridium tyrobutyricum]MCI1239377.1 hypothetical protein [Clostridium tyrobutyricum]MCI1652759.1 hypothetical protein [Clostridium tyrobutyricum]MCI1937111.1 hypothetical protein [Clostridium tyrobutyricum]
MRKNYRMKKTISVKMFISELGEKFSEHVKDRLMDLDIRCVLGRKDKNYIVDVKHVEHIKYACNEGDNSKVTEKEYVYGEFIVIQGVLYFSREFIKTPYVMQSDVANKIYDSLTSEEFVFNKNNEEDEDENENKFEDVILKKVDDTNIDFIIDSILEVCPNVSQKYLDIVKEMTSHAEIKKNNTFHVSTY